ncbi:phage tail tape measure protein [Sodalis sp. RH19]|uniref:phage tail tape measure protein n=1 Tax=Sodalis sp. RH19 TaxID=3394334 RepID=UPI0039B3BC85
MNNKLQLQVLLKAVDRASRPFRAVQNASRQLAGDIRATDKTLRALDQQVGKIEMFRKVKAQLTATGAALRQARQETARLEKAFSALDNPTGKHIREMDKARRGVIALEEKYRGLRRSVKTQRLELSAAGISTRRLSSEQKRLQENADTVTRTLNRQQDALVRLSQQQQRLSHISQRYQAGKALAGGIAGKSSAALATATGALYAEGRWLAPGMNFDRQMSSTRAILDLDKQDPKLQAMRQQARDIGATTAFSPTDVARTQTTLARSGLDAEAILATTGTTVNLSLAGEVDIAEAADIITNMQSAFHIPVAEISRVADVMTKGFTSANSNLQAFSEAMKYAAPLARAAGASIEDATAMLGVLAENGIKGSMAGTGISAMFTRLQAPVGEAADALDELQVKTRDKKGNFLPMVGVLKSIAASMKKHRLGTAQQTEYLKVIFGEEALKSAQNLVEAADNGNLDNRRHELTHSHGITERVARVQTDNLIGDLKNLTSALEDIRIQLFAGQDEGLRRLTQSATAWIGKVGEWTKKNPELTNRLTRLAGAITLLLGGLAVLGLAAWPVITGFNLMLAGAGILSTGIAIAGGAIGATFATLAWPVTLAVAAIVAGALLIRKYWQPIKAFIGGVAEGFAAIVGPLVEIFGPIKPVFLWLSEKLKALWTGFNTLMAPVKATGDTLNSATRAGRIFGEGLAMALTFPMTALNTLRDGIDWILDKLGLINNASETLTGADQQLATEPATAYGYAPTGAMIYGTHPILDQIKQADKPIQVPHATATAVHITVPYTARDNEHLTPDEIGRIAGRAAVDELDKRQRQQRARQRSSMTY